MSLEEVDVIKFLSIRGIKAIAMHVRLAAVTRRVSTVAADAKKAKGAFTIRS